MFFYNTLKMLRTYVYPFLTRSLSEIWSVFSRFPLSVFACLGLTSSLIALARDWSSDFFLSRAALCFALLALGALLSDLLTESRRVLHRIIGYVLVVIAVGGYYVFFPDSFEGMREVFWLRYGVTLFALHLAVALSMLRISSDSLSFWQSNTQLFMRYLFSVLNVIILFAGVALALYSVEKLFGLNWSEEIYGDLWFVCTFLLHPLLFMGGVPSVAASREGIIQVAKPLRFTLQYIAFPLVLLYSAILYAYVGKIAVQMTWPNGWVAMPIFILVVISLMTYLLSLPLREEITWVRLYHRFLFPVLLPLTLVLMLAIHERVSAYGLTEARYFAALLAFWVFALSVAQITLRKKSVSIAWIPGTLFILSLLSVWGGGISAMHMSLVSQLERLEHYANQAGMVKAGQWVAIEDSDENTNEQLIEIIDYLIDRHGVEVLMPYLNSFFDSQTREPFLAKNSWQQKKQILDYLRLKRDPNNDYFHFRVQRNRFETKDTDYVVQLSSVYRESEVVEFDDVVVRFEKAFSILYFENDLGEIARVSFENAFEHAQVNHEKQVLEFPLISDLWRGHLLITNATFRNKELDSFGGVLFYSEMKHPTDGDGL